MKAVDIYIGTSIRGPGKGTGRVMYLMKCRKNNGEEHESIPEIAEQDSATENSLVLFAISEALKRFNYACDIRIHTECCYVAAALNQHWPEAWKAGGWMNSRGKPVTDKGIWEKILEAVEETGHILTAREGKHEWSEWMRWKLPLEKPYKDMFLKVTEK